MNNFIKFWVILVFILFVSSCSVSNSHQITRQDIRYFKKKGDKMASLTADINSYSTGIYLNGSYAVSSNIYLSGGLDAYAFVPVYKIFKYIGENYYRDYDQYFHLRGAAGTIGVGGYGQNNQNNYTEWGASFSLAFNTMHTIQSLKNTDITQWNYRPFSTRLYYAVGQERSNVGFAFSASLYYIDYRQWIPYQYQIYTYYQKKNEIEIESYIRRNLYVIPAINIRIGKKPLKGTLSIGMAIPAHLTTITEPVINLSAGVLMTFNH